ncbi:hypothetical protein G4923_09180 [Aeromonas rivipollensis]|uniref:Uncharacterized protein n=1 Tax=Aeromonas rivipollensis TaxID=948519 RepID=A0ABX0D202_9GAMM|nr:hypothetical protein [Aeromonas rivipollensis]NEX88875.1 hypothetical protein [Aeromonas rivipollensis]NEY06979.1 hypothetical protein [Aeromonas rivipollensis]
MAQVQTVNENLTFKRGDSERIQMFFENEDEETGLVVPVDFTDLEVVIQFRYQHDDPTIVFSLPWILIGPAKNGIGYFNLTRSLSETLAAPYGMDKRATGFYDVQFWSKKDPEAAFTPVAGSWSIDLDASRKS